MSIQSQKQGRRRTFRVEALESRALLSTAAYGTHSTPVAPILSPVELVSRAAGDPTIKTKLQGQLLFQQTEITFSAGGFVNFLKHEPTPVLFKGSITKVHKIGKDELFKVGAAQFFDQNEPDDYFVFALMGGSVDKQKFKASGKTIPRFGSGGIFRGRAGTFTATGTVKGNGDLTMELTIHYM